MNSKTELLNNLFDEWEGSKPEYKGKFVRDGIINEELFTKVQPKILFIAKEPNNPNQKPGDFREWWKKECTDKILYRMAEWIYGLLHKFPQYEDINEDKRHELIQNIAFMNIEKTGGDSRSKNNKIIRHLEMNLDFLRKQIDIISPDIIVTGTGFLKKVREDLFENTLFESDCNIYIGKYKNSKIIDYYHPSSRTLTAEAYYYLLRKIINSTQFKQL